METNTVKQKKDFFWELDKVLLEDYKEEIKVFGEEANQPSVLSELLRMEEDYGNKKLCETATKDCDSASSLVCGRPLCDTCVCRYHTRREEP